MNQLLYRLFYTFLNNQPSKLLRYSIPYILSIFEQIRYKLKWTYYSKNQVKWTYYSKNQVLYIISWNESNTGNYYQIQLQFSAEAYGHCHYHTHYHTSDAAAV